MTNASTSEPRILKIVTCPSLSGRSTLTYHVGSNAQGEVCFRIWNTSGKGVYSKEWVPASDIHKVLSTRDGVVALSLLPVFKVGRSVNTAGFLLAALKNEGLVVASAEVAHRYLAADAKVFVQEVSALIKTGTTLDAAQVPQLKKTRRAAAPAWARDQQPE